MRSVQFSFRDYLTWFILAVGSLQIGGFLTGMEGLRNLGRLTTASPLPLVFSDFRGLETFSLDFTLKGEFQDGTTSDVVITPQIYGKFPGPYNRRNVYGAVLAYSPKLTLPHESALVQSVLHYAFCKNGPLLGIFGDKKEMAHLAIEAKSKAATDLSTYTSEVNCQ